MHVKSVFLVSLKNCIESLIYNKFVYFLIECSFFVLEFMGLNLKSIRCNNSEKSTELELFSNLLLVNIFHNVGILKNL